VEAKADGEEGRGSLRPGCRLSSLKVVNIRRCIISLVFVVGKDDRFTKSHASSICRGSSLHRNQADKKLCKLFQFSFQETHKRNAEVAFGKYREAAQAIV
jgi:hypothetical protein